MRVVCINDSEQYGGPPFVKKGNIYTVVNSEYSKQEDEDGQYYNPAGNYHELLETGPDTLFHESCFLPINEDQQDETEMERDYNSIKEATLNEYESEK